MYVCVHTALYCRVLRDVAKDNLWTIGALQLAIAGVPPWKARRHLRRRTYILCLPPLTQDLDQPATLHAPCVWLEQVRDFI